MSGGPFNFFSLRGLLYAPFYLLGIVRGTFFLLMSLVFKGPRWVFHRKTRETRPACMEDPQLGTHRFIKVKDLTLHVVESGDHKNPLMLFLHGFPECWYSFRHQIRAFNKQYHCVAFDMRGAGESDAPQSRQNYTLDLLDGDISGLIHDLGHTSCILVGHDIGGMISWVFAARYPEMVDKLIVINAAHPDRYKHLIDNYFIPQLWLSWYVFFFQFPYLPELLISMGDYNVLRVQCMKGPTTKEDIEAFKYALSRPGRVKSIMNFYRTAVVGFITGCGQVNAPTLFVWATEHFALHNKLAEGTEKLCPRVTIKRVEGGDLLLHQEQPDLVNRLMKNYLEG